MRYNGNTKGFALCNTSFAGANDEVSSQAFGPIGLHVTSVIVNGFSTHDCRFGIAPFRPRSVKDGAVGTLLSVNFELNVEVSGIVQGGS